MNFKKYMVALVALVSSWVTISSANAADTKLSIGSCPIGCTAYTWSAGIADVIKVNKRRIK